MIYQYAILKQDQDLYPMVRERKWLFWREWKKIIKRGRRFELVPIDQLIYSDGFHKCRSIINDFKHWKEKESILNIDESLQKTTKG